MTGEESSDRKRQLAEFIESDYAVVRDCRVIANSPDRSPDERRDAVAAIQGHLMRIAMLEEQLAQCAAVEARAHQTTPGRTARSELKARRDSIIDDAIRANPTMRVKRLADMINAELAKHDGFKPVSDDYVSKRKRLTIGSTVSSN